MGGKRSMQGRHEKRVQNFDRKTVMEETTSKT
jgi:hypothetical protein